MRKIYKTILILFFNFIIISLIYGLVKKDVTVERDIPSSASQVNDILNTNNTNVYEVVEIPIYIEDSLDTTLKYEELQSALALIPGKIIKELIKDEWKIVLREDKGQNKGCYGSIDVKNKELSVKTDNWETGYTRQSLLHAIGHYIDYKKDYYSSSNDFLKIVEENKAFKEDCLDSYEFLAYAYISYFEKPDELKENFPVLYECCNNLIKR